ncbi:EamA family transporter [Streptosporangium sp. DT93]|uniref:EamA family transporter n=1 Tax=Streptosporangium sp. DT93 TaxID=3393428 RepID=UPI003CF3BFD3
MEANVRWVLVTATAPIAWGATYLVTDRFLPPGHPLYGAAIRALPAGLLLLLLRRRLPHGSWWWRSAVLGTLNMSAFFALIYVAAQSLPTSVASTIMATSPAVMMLLAWTMVSERPRIPHLAGAGVGVAGVCLMLFTGTAAVDPVGVLASVTAMVMSSIGYVLAKRWNSADTGGAGGAGSVDVLSSTSWQLIAGGIVLLPFAVVLEGAPPALDVPAVLGFGYVTVIATALAFAAWFAGLRHLPTGTVGLVGLLNPVTGVLLGTLVAREALSARQLCGLALTLLGVLLGRPATARLLPLLRGRQGWQGRQGRPERPDRPGSTADTAAPERDRQAGGTRPGRTPPGEAEPGRVEPGRVEPGRVEPEGGQPVGGAEPMASRTRTA